MTPRRRLVGAAFAAAALLLASGPGCDAVDPAGRAARVEAMADGYAARFPQVPQISAAALRSGAFADAVMVDCRTAEERSVSVLPGALDAAAFDADPERYAGQPVVVYCTIGYRSAEHVGRLRERGIDAHNLRDGVLGWAHAGGTFVTPDGEPTESVHVYGRSWNQLPESYDAVY